MASKKSKLKKMLQASERESRKEQGFFDGRFSTRVYRSKKTYSRKLKYKNKAFE